jgi:uncharacterized membrane protein YeaQ/YmgE (transglycosylase-associated protein family)
MSVVMWALFGLVVGFIASKLMNSTGPRLLLDIVLGVGGAVIAGVLLRDAGIVGLSAFNLWNLFVAVCGACVLLFVYHAAAGQRPL